MTNETGTSSSGASSTFWFFLGENAVQKGPFPVGVLLKLLEKNISGINGQTLVWTHGMETWQPMSTIEPFRSVVNFHEMQWFYMEGTERRGPLLTRMLLHKLHSGAIDGLTLVYSASMTSWSMVADVPSLRDSLQRMEDEERGLFGNDETTLPESEAYEESKTAPIGPFHSSAGTSASGPEASVAAGAGTILRKDKSTNKRSFRADDGIRYVWDAQEQDWIEGNDESSEDEDEAEGGGDRGSGDKGDGKDSQDALTIRVQGDADKGSTSQQDGGPGAKRKRPKKRKPRDHNWVYITGLPLDTSLAEVKEHFSKVGIISINPSDQLPRIKLYHDESGHFKGDCSLRYHAPESVTLAVDVLSGGYFRPGYQVTVVKADFTASASASRGDGSARGADSVQSSKRPRSLVTQAQLKVAQTAMRQALAWNEDDDSGVDKSKALRIVVLEGMFVPEDFAEESFAKELEEDIASECGKCGGIDKITVFSKNPRGIAVVKFNTAYAAESCIKTMDGRFFAGRKLRCYFWDGSTDYTVTAPAEEEEKQEVQRLDEFGDWLDHEQDDLPEEFQLKVES